MHDLAYVIMVFADDLAPNWRQVICSHHAVSIGNKVLTD